MFNNSENNDHKIKELEQENKFLEKINEKLSFLHNKDEKKTKSMSENLESEHRKINELEQEKRFLTKSIEHVHAKNLKLSKKYLLTIFLAAAGIAAISVGYSIMITDIVGQQYRISDADGIRSNYVIQNLRGDTIDTWLSWRLVEGDTINVTVINSDQFPDKMPVIKKVVTSFEEIEIDDSLLHKGKKGETSLYHVGWAGALSKAAKTKTQFYIPENFEVTESSQGEGDITITLSTLRNGDGYSGFTKSIADETQNQILKSQITIYETDKLSDSQFETILRHEFGHALGLAHSTAPEDLMHPTIETEFPYISQCNVDAIILLYDGGKKSEVVCKN